VEEEGGRGKRKEEKGIRGKTMKKEKDMRSK
jgi:hypothetical protein